MAHPAAPPLAGWKNFGKTTLIVGLVEELTRREFRAVQAAIVGPAR